MTAENAPEVTIRERRNHGGRVLDRVARGEIVTVTRHGTPLAELRPLRRAALPTAESLLRAKRTRKVDPDRLRDDIDAVLDQRGEAPARRVGHFRGAAIARTRSRGFA